MKRIEVNCQTGESVEIEQAAYKDAQNKPFLLDVGQPYGDLIPITEGELQQLTTLTLAAEEEEIKRRLLAAAMVKRDILLVHLERLRTRAIEANNTTSRDALSTAITSLENIFNDPRVVNATDGAVKDVLDECKDEIGLALAMASPATYFALKALDPL